MIQAPRFRVDDGARPTPRPPARSGDRPTRRYLARYWHDGAWWASEVQAYSFADAEARCRRLGMELDGQHVATVPCGPQAASVLGAVVRFGRWIRMAIRKKRRDRAGIQGDT